MGKNTAYRVHVEDVAQSVVDNVNIEDGAMLRTDDYLYMGHNSENVIVYPQGGVRSLGWARYQDTVYTSSNKLALSDGVQVALPNNSGTTIKSHSSINFYDSTTVKLTPVNLNDVYIVSLMLKASASTANQTHLEIEFQHGSSGSTVENLFSAMAFYKGNDVEQKKHEMYSFYVDANVLSLGASIHITSVGGSANVWDIEYFIQRTQNGSLS